MDRLEYTEFAARKPMSEGTSEFSQTHTLPNFQRNAIVGLADIRRWEQSLSSQLTTLTKNIDTSEISLREAFEDQSNTLQTIMRGKAPIAPDGKDIPDHLRIGVTYQNIAPNLSALHFSKAAALQQEQDSDYTENLTKARRALEQSEKNEIPRQTPADFLPDAYILRVARKATEGVSLPSIKEIAQACADDPSLIRDYALVLPESQREEFLSFLPDSKREQVSLQLDAIVSSVLNRNLISSDEDVDQRDAVKERVIDAFAEALLALKDPQYATQMLEDGRGTGSRWTARKLTDTLANLGEEDAIRVIREVADRSTRGVKDLNKEIRKMPLDARTTALRPFLSFDARVLNTLIDVDIKRGGTLTMRYLEMSALPDRLFNFFTQKLIKNEYLTKSLSPFLSAVNIPVLKKIMAKHGPQFNTIIDTLSQTSGFKSDFRLDTRSEELFEALSDLETLTPLIYERYRRMNPEERKGFAQKIRELKPQFFRNAPIKSILDSKDRDILTEMVYMAYKPMGMSFEQVGDLIGQIDDHTQDLDGYTFPEDGYPLRLEGAARYVLKDRQRVDLDSLWRYRTLFATRPIQETTEGEQKPKTPFAHAIQSLIKSTNIEEQADTQHGQPERNTDQILNALLIPFQDHVQVMDFLGRYTKTNESAHAIASELAELTGVYFRDNFTQAVTGYLEKHPDEFNKIRELFGDLDVRRIISERLSQVNMPVDWDGYDQAATVRSEGIRRVFSRRERPSVNLQVASTSEILRNLIEFDQIEPIRKQIESELSKFTLSADNAASYRGTLKAYISKNVGSFFAKAAAGLCTKDDIPLFERPDHFHINVVEGDETVRANIQAYVRRVNRQNVLILRGFNPTAEWVSKIDIDAFNAQVIQAAKQFQQENGLEGVYITESLERWHALSNREQVQRRLVEKYITGKDATPYTFPIASHKSVDRIYQV